MSGDPVGRLRDAVGRSLAALDAALSRVPLWPELVSLARIAVSPAVAFARALLHLFPFLTRLEWLLELRSLTRRHPVPLALALAYVTWRGLHVTELGHIGTDPMIYPFVAVVSGFNPCLGLACGLAFGAGDLLQKLVQPDIFGAAGWRDSNYWSAIGGYAVSYTSLMAMGVLPGALARVARAAARLAWHALFARRRAATADGLGRAENAFLLGGAPEYPAVELLAAVVAGGYGGYLTMDTLAPRLERPAFMWRPDPDHSCLRVEVEKWLRGRAPVGARAGAVAGGVVGLVPPPGGPGPEVPRGPAGPAGPAAPADPAGPADPVRRAGPAGSAGPEIVDPWSRETLVRWEPGRYGAGSDGEEGRAGDVWWNGRWVPADTAREAIAEGLAAEAERARETDRFWRDAQARSEQWMRDRVRTNEEEAARTRRDDERDARLFHQAGEIDDVIAEELDPERRRFLRRLADRFVRREAGGGVDGDPAKLDRVLRYLRRETVGARGQRAIDAAADAAADAEAWEGTATGIRDTAVQAEGMLATGLVNPLSAAGALVQAGFGATTGYLAGADPGGVVLGATIGGASGFFRPLSVEGSAFNALVGGVHAWTAGEDQSGIVRGATANMALGWLVEGAFRATGAAAERFGHGAGDGARTGAGATAGAGAGAARPEEAGLFTHGSVPGAGAADDVRLQMRNADKALRAAEGTVERTAREIAAAKDESERLFAAWKANPSAGRRADYDAARQRVDDALRRMDASIEARAQAIGVKEDASLALRAQLEFECRVKDTYEAALRDTFKVPGGSRPGTLRLVSTREELEHQYKALRGKGPGSGVAGFNVTDPRLSVGVRREGTVLHELLHANTDPDFRKQLGSKLNEGCTELLVERFKQARGLAGDVKWDRTGHYRVEKAVAVGLERVVGAKTLQNAYFNGDLGSLHYELGTAFGHTDPAAAESFGRTALGRLGALLSSPAGPIRTRAVAAAAAMKTGDFASARAALGL